MIYVYVDSKRMAYLKYLLNAKGLEDSNELLPGDTIVFPILDRNKRQLPLKKGKLNLNQLSGYNLFFPFPYSFIKESNNVFYYMKDKTLIQKNALLTANGILAYLSDLPISIFATQIDVIGYGFCGKEIVKVLNNCGIKLRVIQREKTCDSFLNKEEYLISEKSEIIVNTAPINYFEEGIINCNQTKYIIDISSEHCIDKNLMEQGIHVIYPGPLPSIYSPYSAAYLIYEYMKGKGYEK